MITIRPIVARDRPQLLDLVSKQKNFTTQEVEVAIEVIGDSLNPQKNDYQIQVAVNAEKEVVGFICYGEFPMTDHRFDLYWVAVNPTLSRHGLGRLLLTRMEAKIAAQGPAKIYVETSSTPGYDPARSFYEKNGYTVAATLENFYRDGDDKVIYLKKLGEKHVGF